MLVQPDKNPAIGAPCFLPWQFVIILYKLFETCCQGMEMYWVEKRLGIIKIIYRSNWTNEREWIRSGTNSSFCGVPRRHSPPVSYLPNDDSFCTLFSISLLASENSQSCPIKWPMISGASWGRYWDETHWRISRRLSSCLPFTGDANPIGPGCNKIAASRKYSERYKNGEGSVRISFIKALV